MPPYYFLATRLEKSEEEDGKQDEVLTYTNIREKCMSVGS